MATCLYKPKPCEQCKQLIPVGAECEYVPETKGVRHWSCGQDEAITSADHLALADSLGFVRHTEAEIRRVAIEWVMWSLPSADPIEDERHRGPARGLFDSVR